MPQSRNAFLNFFKSAPQLSEEVFNMSLSFHTVGGLATLKHVQFVR